MSELNRDLIEAGLDTERAPGGGRHDKTFDRTSVAPGGSGEPKLVKESLKSDIESDLKAASNRSKHDKSIVTQHDKTA